MVFKPEGRDLGDVSMPRPFDPRAIAENKADGLWFDELRVETVRVFEPVVGVDE